jgi:hypothetical protein
MTGRPVPYWPAYLPAGPGAAVPYWPTPLVDQIADEIIEAAQAAYGHTPEAFAQAVAAVAATEQISFPEAVPAVGVAAG